MIPLLRRWIILAGSTKRGWASSIKMRSMPPTRATASSMLPWVFCSAPRTINCAVFWRMSGPPRFRPCRQSAGAWRGINILSAGLQQLFPTAGALAPIAGELWRAVMAARRYAADRHGVDILRRAGYSKDMMLDSLTWIRRVSGSAGGGISIHAPRSRRAHRDD